MKPITVNLLGKYTDGYIYLGRLFLVEMNGTVSSISMDVLIAQIRGNDKYNLAKIAFLRNDWLSNQQGENIFRIPGQLNNFKIAWSKLANSELVIESSSLKLDKHFEIPDAPVFDIRAYGLKLYIGNRNGLYESQFEVKSDEFKDLYQPSKIFDARTTYMSAKSGELMVSSNSDGLFRGKVGTPFEKTIINNDPISTKSIRTGWSSYDVLNYESQNNFVYYVNEVGVAQNQPRVPYSANDESSERKEITNFGVSVRRQDELLPNKLKEATIKYSYNSSNFCFFLTSDNVLYRSRFIKRDNTIHLSNRGIIQDEFERVLDLKGKTKIISTTLIPSGTIIETLSSVILTSSGLKPIVLHNYPIYALKTFLSSKRFRNIVLVFHESGLSIHSLFPVYV